MRGKAQQDFVKFFCWRITPAYAGKSFEITCYNVPNKDHPRLCGEKGAYMDETISIYRITPAYAGKSMILYVWHYLQGDHPRLCGEKVHSFKPRLHF